MTRGCGTLRASSFLYFCYPDSLERQAMQTPAPREITQLLHAWSQGDEAALATLAPLVDA
jgi:hypothetical protein